MWHVTDSQGQLTLKGERRGHGPKVSFVLHCCVSPGSGDDMGLKSENFFQVATYYPCSCSSPPLFNEFFLCQLAKVGLK